MEKLTIVTGKAAYLPLANIDTDMIIPKQYLKTIKRSGLGRYLFAELRYDTEGTPLSDFVLNVHPDTKILMTGENFGCGSSREHAPWALLDFGIRVLIAPSFSDIFYNNCFKNGILPVQLSPSNIEKLGTGQQELTINLEEQYVESALCRIPFSIEPHRKEVLLKGLDDIEQILTLQAQILQFEEKHFTKCPWII